MEDHYFSYSLRGIILEGIPPPNNPFSLLFIKIKTNLSKVELDGNKPSNFNST